MAEDTMNDDDTKIPPKRVLIGGGRKWGAGLAALSAALAYTPSPVPLVLHPSATAPDIRTWSDVQPYGGPQPRNRENRTPKRVARNKRDKQAKASRKRNR